MRGSIFALQLLGLLQLGKSQTSCTSDVAIPIDEAAASGSGSGSDADAAAIASYQVAGASAIVDLTGTNLDGGSGGPADLIDIGSDPLRRLLRKRVLRKRAALECTSSETCYSLQGSPLCVDDQTNDFHLDDGTTGNLDTGDYTLPDGREGNFATGPYPTLAASASTTFDAAATSAISTGDPSTITNAAASTDPSTTAAASTSASTPTESAASTLAAETGALSSSTRTPQAASSTESAGSSLAAETETSTSSSSTRTLRTTSSTTSAAASPTTSAQIFRGDAARYSTSNLVLLAAMGLRAMF